MSFESVPVNIREIIKDSYPAIEELNPAQQAVIDAGFLDDPENFIIAIPTASGKTLLGVMRL
jgi:helicase